MPAHPGQQQPAPLPRRQDQMCIRDRQGTISKNTLLTAQDDLAQAQDAVATAHHNLFTAYHTYLWAVEYGILN